MTPEERRARIRELVDGLDAREIDSLILGLRQDIAKEADRRSQVEALLAERRTYERLGDDARVRAVDEQLAFYGHVSTTRGSRARGAAA